MGGLHNLNRNYKVMATPKQGVYDLILFKGDDEEVKFILKSDSVPTDITGSVMLFECAVASLTRQALIPAPTTGEFTFEFPAADTVDLTDTVVAYEVVRYPNGLAGTRATLFYGELCLQNERVK